MLIIRVTSNFSLTLCTQMINGSSTLKPSPTLIHFDISIIFLLLLSSKAFFLGKTQRQSKRKVNQGFSGVNHDWRVCRTWEKRNIISHEFRFRQPVMSSFSQVLQTLQWRLRSLSISWILVLSIPSSDL